MNAWYSVSMWAGRIFIPCVVIVSSLSLAAACAVLSGCQNVATQKTEQAFLATVGTGIRMDVYPTIVRRERISYDMDSAREVTDWLATNGVAGTRLLTQEIAIPHGWRMNKSRMYRESVESIQQHIADHPISAHYAVVAEYLLNERSSKAVGIHLYIIDPAGSLVFSLDLNSRNPALQKAEPQSIADCTTLLIAVLEDEMLAN